MSIQDWFPRLPEHIRESLLENPDQDIDGGTNVAIAKARGVGVPIIGWQSVPGSQGAQLSGEDQEWLENQRELQDDDAPGREAPQA